MIEEWKEIKGYEGLYSISNLGRVKSHSKKSGFLTLKERIMSPTLKGKRIGRYNKNGTLLQEYNNALEAAHSFGKVRGSDILRCCRGERKFAYGFMWKFLPDAKALAEPLMHEFENRNLI